MAFTNLGSDLTKQRLYEGILSQAINNESIDWVFRTASTDLILGKVLNSRFNLGMAEMDSLQNTAAVAASSTAMAAVAASSTAMAAVIASSTAMAAVIASSTAMAAVAASSTAITALDNSYPITIPTMTSNTTPSGVASAIVETADPNAGAYRAMNKAITSGTGWYCPGTTNKWIQYKFTSGVWCYKATLLWNNAGNEPGSGFKNFKVQYSANGTDFTDAITSITINNTSEQTFIVCAPSSKVMYWRIMALDNWGSSAYIGITEINFYCK